MSSPAQAGDDSKDDNKKILFRFCAECSNLLFPKEDKDNNRLLYACRTCAYSEPAQSACVMRHDIASSVGDTAGITQDVAQDPTVSLSQSLSETNLTDMDDPPMLCTMCGQEIFCEICGGETENGLYLEVEDSGSGSQGASSFLSGASTPRASQRDSDKHSSSNEHARA